MKRLFSISVLATILTTGGAQTNMYRPFPDSNFIWVEHYLGLDFTCPCGGTGSVCLAETDYQLYLGDDTVINGFTYRHVIKTGHTMSYMSGPYTCPPGQSPPWHSYFVNQHQGFIRQDTSTRKVYFMNDWNPVDELLYVFDLNLGDTLPATFYTGSGFNYVSQIDSVSVNSVYHKRYWLSVTGSPVSSDQNYTAIIEGIGNIQGLLTPLIPPFESNCDLLCAYNPSVLVYPDSTFVCAIPDGISENTMEAGFSVFPNPSTGIFNVVSTEKIISLEIFNIHGASVIHSTPQHTTTIIDLGHYSPGMYMVSALTASGNRFSKRVLLR